MSTLLKCFFDIYTDNMLYISEIAMFLKTGVYVIIYIYMYIYLTGFTKSYLLMLGQLLEFTVAPCMGDPLGPEG